jgi:hypothetical protein
MEVSLLVPSEYLTETLSWVDPLKPGITAPVNNPDKKDRKLRRLAAIPGAVQGPARRRRGTIHARRDRLPDRAYMLSQFYRAFLAVLAPRWRPTSAPRRRIWRAPRACGSAFALMQLPVGWALDTLGPRRTASVLFLIGAAGGAALFARRRGPA